MTALSELRVRVEAGGPERLWAAWRYLDAVVEPSREATESELAFAHACFLLLLKADPDWAEEKSVERGPWGTGLHRVVAHEVEALIEAVPPERALLRARLLMLGATESWRRWKANEGERALLARAWSELQTVEQRDEAWFESALDVTAHADFPAYRELAAERLEHLFDYFWRSDFLGASIEAAAHHRDWSTLERWAAEYRKLPEAFRDAHKSCALLNWEGLHALDEARFDDAEAKLREVVALAPEVQFLTNQETSMLPRRMRAEGRCLALCDAFDEIVTRKDWRVQRRKAGG